MKNRFWDRRIPTFLGILFLAVSIGITTFLVKQGGLLTTSAFVSHDPKDVRIANVTDISFTITYFTKDPTSGVVNFGETKALGKSALDDKDKSGTISNHKLHTITVNNLTPNSKYYFSIISGKDTYTNNSDPFEITTGAKIDEIPPEQDSITGNILLPNGQSPKEAILYLTAGGAQVISSAVKPDGSFLLPLNILRTQNLNSYFKIENDTVLKLLVVGDELSSNVLLSPAKINPVPTITLSNDYDFTLSEKPQTQVLPENTFPSFSSSTEDETKKPQIITPLEDQNFTDTKPQFKGTAMPGEEVEIIIRSEENINTTVTADGSGNWTYTPSSPLSSGQHTITITTKDASGILKTITQNFVVYASGNDEEGSPTLTPTFSFTNTPTASSSPTPPIPPTGNPVIITAGIVGLLLSLIGGLLYLLTRGKI